MKIIEHQDVRVTVGELSRGQQLRFWQTVQQDETPEDELLAYAINQERVAVLATRKIEVCIDGEWQPLNGAHEIEDGVSISAPITEDQLRALPYSLVQRWTQAAEAANGGLVQLLSLFTASPENSIPSSDS